MNNEGRFYGGSNIWVGRIIWWLGVKRERIKNVLEIMNYKCKGLE